MTRRLLLLSVLSLAVAAWWLRGLPAEEAPSPRAVEPVRRPVLVDGSEPTAAPEGDLAVDRVECPLVAVPEAPLRLRLVELDHDTMEPVDTVDARIRDGAVRFEPRDADVGVGTLIGDGIEPKVVVWALGVCTEDVELSVHPHFDVVAMFDGGEEAEHVYVRMTCRTADRHYVQGGLSPDADGTMHFRGLVREGCSLEAFRHHGSSRLESEPVPLRATTEPQEVLLDIPPLHATGLGGYLDREGVRIDAIAPGSRGERAGLLLRDLVFPHEETDETVDEWLDRDEPLPVWVERDGERFDTVI